QGLQAASGEYLVLLNNDTVVTDGWLDQLIALASTRIDGAARDAPVRADRSDEIPPNLAIIDRTAAAQKAHRETFGRLAGGAISLNLAASPLGERMPEGQVRGDDLGHLLSRGRRASPAPRAIGLVGPMSNYASPPQLVEDVPYRDLVAMHHFAARWRDEH